MEGINCYGRGWRDPYFVVTPISDGVQIRIDDHKNDEAWLVVSIEKAALLELLNVAGVQLDQAGDLDQLPRVQMPDTPDLPPPGPI